MRADISRSVRFTFPQARPSENGSAFIIVLWIAFGLVSVSLYFGHSMVLELRASENRMSGLAAEQAIEGAVRYISNLLATQAANGSNGFAPVQGSYVAEAVPVGAAHFWLIGRDTNSPISGPGQLSFALVEESSKLNLNSASSNMFAALLESLPNANADLAGAIVDWRDTNSTGLYQTYYATRPQPYQTKNGPFESVDELRLVYGGDVQTLMGDDANLNGVLDPGESDQNHNGQLDAGVLEYVTVYSREPNTQTNGAARVNIRTVTGSTGPLPTLLQTVFGSSRADQILANLGLTTTGRGGPGGGGRGATVTATANFTSPMQFYRLSRMTADEFGQIANSITLTNGTYIEGRVNVNTASAPVLASLPGLDTNPDLAQTLISYRQSNPDKLGSIAWVADALGQNNASALQALQARDCITVQTYQFTADVAALGPNGRGYRRMRFVFDTSSGTPMVVYRKDLTYLGWALGKETRDTWLFAKTKR